MYLHKIRLEKGNQAFSGRTLGNSLTWSVTYDGEGGLTLLHRSGRVSVPFRGSLSKIS